MYNLKGWFLHKGSYIFHAWHLNWAAVWIRPSAECFVHDGADKGQEVRSGAFQAPEADRKQYSHPTEQDDDTGGAVTYMHLHVHTHTQYRGDAYLIHVRLLIKTGWAVTYERHSGTNAHENVWREKSWQCLPYCYWRVYCLWGAVYRSNVGGVNI